MDELNHYLPNHYYEQLERESEPERKKQYVVKLGQDGGEMFRVVIPAFTPHEAIADAMYGMINGPYKEDWTKINSIEVREMC